MRQKIHNQSIMINKLFHMIEKKHSYDQISSESESYLSILMLIAKHKVCDDNVVRFCCKFFSIILVCSSTTTRKCTRICKKFIEIIFRIIIENNE